MYLFGLPLSTLGVDSEGMYRHEVVLLERAVSRVDEYGMGDIETADAIQARIDRVEEMLANPWHKSWFFGGGLRLGIHILLAEGRFLGEEMLRRYDLRKLQANA
ncbi:hypothetical protein AURDEDRAFT_178689 [Auricularia subglabra TFB-10046 SS5]|uniref:Uncharacterized protein n=1 Tax=Auricularia subglabra (strain TFB-10046 / SS5) TaxID=717982 RepID=J0L7H4_AURST|nr:hypothetical protein AURDEDRAFT_178689 [Auricularia subglabra TFB-10046 SS5]